MGSAADIFVQFGDFSGRAGCKIDIQNGLRLRYIDESEWITSFTLTLGFMGHNAGIALGGLVAWAQ